MSVDGVFPVAARVPAWEDDSKLETKNIAFPCTSFWRLRIPRFHSVLFMAQTEHTNPGARPTERRIARRKQSAFHARPGGLEVYSLRPR